MSFSLGKCRKADKESSTQSESPEDSLEPATLRVALAAACGECGLSTNMVMISQYGSSQPQSVMLPVTGGLRGNSHDHPDQ